MKFSHKKTQTLLQQWGKKNTTLPPKHAALKSTMFDSFKPQMQQAENKVQKPRFRFSWVVITGAGVVAVIIFFLHNAVFPPQTYVAQRMTATQAGMSGEMKKDLSYDALGLSYADSEYSATKSSLRESFSEVPFFSSRSAPIIDDREFLQTDYSARIKTRHIDEIGQQLATTIRGHGGRVDTLSIQERGGYIRFALPKDSLAAFQNEMKYLVNARFLTEGTSQQNRLAEKRSLEQQEEDQQRTLTSLYNSRQNLIDQHQATVRSLEGEIAYLGGQIKLLEEEMKKHPEKTPEIQAEKESLTKKKRLAENRLWQKRQEYNAQIQSLDAQIQNTHSQITYIKNQDQNLINEVETVEGTIYLDWLSIFTIAREYFTDYWFLFLLVIPPIIILGKKREIRLP